MGELIGRWTKITQLIGRAIAENGGTSSHVTAVEITIPALTFDMLEREFAREGRLASLGDPQTAPRRRALLNGVTLLRGATNGQVRRRAHEWSGV